MGKRGYVGERADAPLAVRRGQHDPDRVDDE
jgi:hypothetical protein